MAVLEGLELQRPASEISQPPEICRILVHLKGMQRTNFVPLWDCSTRSIEIRSKTLFVCHRNAVQRNRTLPSLFLFHSCKANRLRFEMAMQDYAQTEM